MSRHDKQPGSRKRKLRSSTLKTLKEQDVAQLNDLNERAATPTIDITGKIIEKLPKNLTRTQTISDIRSLAPDFFKPINNDDKTVEPSDVQTSVIAVKPQASLFVPVKSEKKPIIYQLINHILDFPNCIFYYFPYQVNLLSREQCLLIVLQHDSKEADIPVEEKAAFNLKFHGKFKHYMQCDYQNDKELISKTPLGENPDFADQDVNEFFGLVIIYAERHYAMLKAPDYLTTVKNDYEAMRQKRNELSLNITNVNSQLYEGESSQEFPKPQ